MAPVLGISFPKNGTCRPVLPCNGKYDLDRPSDEEVFDGGPELLLMDMRVLSTNEWLKRVVLLASLPSILLPFMPFMLPYTCCCRDTLFDSDACCCFKIVSTLDCFPVRIDYSWFGDSRESHRFRISRTFLEDK